MLGPVDYALWIAAGLAEALAVVCLLRARAIREYPTLSLYLFFSLLNTVARYIFLHQYGFGSREYFYFYYFSDALMTILLYCALMGLYSCVFHEMGVQRYLRFGAILLLGATAWFSYQVVVSSSHKLLTRFVVELSQNLYFIGLVLTYLLWGAIMKLRETRTRLIQLVLALGVYFSAFAANYALRNLYPGLGLVWRYLPPLLAVFLPLAWAYSFSKVPEEARLVPTRLAIRHR